MINPYVESKSKSVVSDYMAFHFGIKYETHEMKIIV